MVSKEEAETAGGEGGVGKKPTEVAVDSKGSDLENGP